MKSIKQLWEETPHGKAIIDPGYRYLCEWLAEKGIPYSIDRMSREIQGFWDMTCEQAVGATSQWLRLNIARNPDFIAEIQQAERAKFWA